MSIRRFDRSINDRRTNPFSGFFRNSFFDNPDFEEPFSPAANIRTREKNYEIDLALPGYDKKDIRIDVSDNVLTISAEEVKESEITEEFTRREFYKSSFERSFSLPDDVNEDKISARMDNGVLRISIGRHDHDPKVRTRTIKVE